MDNSEVDDAVSEAVHRYVLDYASLRHECVCESDS